MSPASVLRKQELLEVGLQGGGGLLEHADSQVRGVSEPLIVGVIADLAMGPPDRVGQARDLSMSGEVTLFPHKAKRRVALKPSKPVGRIRLKAQPSFLWTDQHVVPVAAIFH